jgi:parvulin-like peptidyl-prolyl isomerase
MAASSPQLPDAQQEAEAQLLARRLHELAEEEFLQIARLLVGKPDRDVFGDTELQVRDILHRAGAKALEEYLRQKKTATKESA